MLSQQKRNVIIKLLETSVINSPMCPPSLNVYSVNKTIKNEIIKLSQIFRGLRDA